MPLTNVRTYVQFSKDGEVYRIAFSGNKLQAMNVIKLAYNVNQLSVLSEYTIGLWMMEGQYWEQ